MLIYLLRHGLTAYNAEKRYQGQRDIPLSPAGRAQLRQADLRPETVYITPVSYTHLDVYKRQVWNSWTAPACGLRCWKACCGQSSSTLTGGPAGRSGWGRCCFPTSTAHWEPPTLPHNC